MRYLAKKSYHLDEDSEGTWAVSYGDMITLLLSFFVIFFTTDVQKEKNQKLTSLMAFDLNQLQEVPQQIRHQGKNATLNFDMKELEGLNVKLHQKDEKLIVTFGKFSFFKSGHTDMRNEGEQILKRFVQIYLPYAGKYRISIKGFTDKSKVSSISGRRFRDNLELSALRSISAMRIMQKEGIPLNRMEIAGAGELKSVSEILPQLKMSTASEVKDYSRTIVLILSPEKESSL